MPLERKTGPRIEDEFAKDRVIKSVEIEAKGRIDANMAHELDYELEQAQMSDTIREQIITAVEAKLAHILTAKGYLTECGANVQRARKTLDQAELPAVVVFPKAESGVREYANSNMTMNLRVEALQEFGTSNPSEVSEQMLADLIECMVGGAGRWLSTRAATSRSRATRSPGLHRRRRPTSNRSRKHPAHGRAGSPPERSTFGALTGTFTE